MSESDAAFGYLTQAEAEALPIEQRVAAYASVHGLTPEAAIWALCEQGLSKYLQMQLELDPDWHVPIYLWVSYQKLVEEMAVFSARQEEKG